MPKGTGLQTNQQPDVLPGEISNGTRLAMELANLPKVDYNNAEQIRDRIQYYFDFCIQTDTRPLIMGICLALGTNRESLRRWENEQTARGEVIRGAKNIIRYMIENWTTSGKLSPAVGIFWMKNLCGWRDVVEIQATAENTLTATKTPEELAQMLETDIPVDDDPEPVALVDME